MKMQVFKNLEQAMDYIISSSTKVNQFYPAVRELEEKGVTKLNDEAIFIDEFNLLN